MRRVPLFLQRNNLKKINITTHVQSKSSNKCHFKAKPSIVNQRCVVYRFVCDLCDADYVGYTARHLFQRVAGHKNSAKDLFSLGGLFSHFKPRDIR